MKTRRTPWLVALGVITILGVSVAAGVWYTRHRPAPPPEPPAVDLTGVDPDVAAAIEEARAQVRQAPNDAWAWGRLGMLLALYNFHTEALQALAEAERLDPQEPRWPYFQGTTLEDSDPEAAITKLRRAAELSSQPVVRVLLGRLLLVQGRFDDAETFFRQAVQQAPNDGRAYLGLAQLARTRHDLPQSITYLRRAAACPGTRKAATTLLAEVYAQHGDTNDARQARQVAAELPDDPDAPDPYADEAQGLVVSKTARINRMQLLQKSGRAREALEQAQKTAKDYPESDLAWLALARAYLDVGRYREAENAVDRAIRLGPGRFESRLVLGFARYHQRAERSDALGQAEEAFRAALRLSPSAAPAHFGLGWCLRYEGKLDEAAAAFQEALRYRPDYQEAHSSLGQLLTEIGRQAALVSALELALGAGLRTPAPLDLALPIRVEARAHLRYAVQREPRDTLAREALDRLNAEYPDSMASGGR